MAEDRVPGATRSELVSAVAHELRSPIAAVRGAAKELLARGDRLDTRTRDRLLRVVEEAAGQLDRLADDLAAIGSLDDGQMRTTVGACDAAVVAGLAVDAALAVDPSREVRFDAGDSLPPVAADRDRLRQIVTNLVENALRHGAPSAPVDVVVRQSDGGVRIIVRDRGPGIDPADLERIFAPGVRLSSAPGTGLGLAIVRELTASMGASLDVVSTPGEGSKFAVELPLA
jgi:signal transduction histidine kinase